MSASQEHCALPDRRKRLRIPAHWTVFLSRESDSHPLETVTKDLSSEGFYCYFSEPLQPGQLLECTLIIPNHGKKTDHLCLKGRVLVIRVESVEERYGIGCQLQDYTIIALARRQMPARASLTQPAAALGL